MRRDRPCLRGGRLYAYPGAARPALAGINLTLRPGQRIALVGENGAGKSTLVRLLLGLYRPNEGPDHRRRCGSRRPRPGQVAQTRHRRLSGLHALPHDRRRERRLWRRRAAARARSRRQRRPSTHRRGGGPQRRGRVRPPAAGWVCHSPGQGVWRCRAVRWPVAAPRARPRLGVDKEKLTDSHSWEARVKAGIYFLTSPYLREAEIVALDEPTAALDPRAEVAIYERYRDAAAGRCAVFISHRLGSCRIAGRILVLCDGQVAEDGPHEALLAAGG
ncbi:MAG: ATP-binding cassette domain-containing protein [Chloroflexi bacterium]|nr:ATP-binding cassette domain-containing protein [Chloroflexota bacterium]